MQNPTHDYYQLKKPTMTAPSQLKNLAVIPTEQLDSFSLAGGGDTEKEQQSIRSTIKDGYEVFVESVYTVNGRKK